MAVSINLLCALVVPIDTEKSRATLCSLPCITDPLAGLGFCMNYFVERTRTGGWRRGEAGFLNGVVSIFASSAHFASLAPAAYASYVPSLGGSRDKMMATVKLSDIEDREDKEPVSKAERLALEFLEVFAADRPLDEEELEEWVEINSLTADEVKEAAKTAVRNRWVEDTDDGLRLTDEGRNKTEE